ncbi:uncharacterized protein N7483_012406 [Penicillium malachiteum]|uniref:uncharacterized protein n=1 Tax=Penicillium malachiteum TaxID=1324776 RepID=UPI0025490A4A|nr:uncharacterized protein N7483_012406 [Penicillium malachiteum]KAJ5715225.1 hypothetical protein N7483_012406 [Penicillium malachiteum]
MLDCNALEVLVMEWFTAQENPQFKISPEKVAQYISAALISVNADQVKEKLCEELNASLLHAPTSIVEKLGSEDVQDSQVVIAVINLIVNGILPPDELCSPTLGIFFELHDLNNRLLESDEESAEPFRVNFRRLADNVVEPPLKME